MFGWFKGLLASLMWSKVGRKASEDASSQDPSTEQSVEPVSEPAAEEAPAPTPEPSPSLSDTCSVVKREGPMVDYKCGHRDAENPTFNLYGEIITFTAEYQKRRKHCADCMLANTLSSIIRCGACGRAILIDAGVAIRFDVWQMKKEWQTAVTFDGMDGAIVCTRSDCCPSPEKFCIGYWTGDGIEMKTFENPSSSSNDDPNLRN